MYEAILRRLEHEVVQNYGASVLRNPPTDEEIKWLIEHSKEKLGIEPHSDYIRFLRVTDGYDWNGLRFYSVRRRAESGKDTEKPEGSFIEGFVEANLDFREAFQNHDLVIYGDSSTDRYIHDRRRNIFLTVDVLSLDEFEQHDSFDDMVLAALKNNM